MMKVKMDDDVVVMDRRREAIEELVRGREFANQLREMMLIKNNDNDNDVEHLVRKVVRSFANTLFLFTKYTHQSLLLKSDDEEEHEEEEHHSHSFKSTSPLKERRGFYKRKRRSIETWNKVSGSQTDHDEHQWRKYGQKRIQNAKYDRNYYRCTHKYDQGCEATKQVQMVKEMPTPSYMVTYFGHHTCRDPADHHQIVLLQDYHHDDYYSSTCSNNSILLSFDNSIPNPPNNPFFSSSSSAAAAAMNNNNNNNNNMRKEGDEVVPSSSSCCSASEPTRRTHLDESAARQQQQQLLQSELEYDCCWDIDAVMMPSSSSGGACTASLDDHNNDYYYF